MPLAAVHRFEEMWVPGASGAHEEKARSTSRCRTRDPFPGWCGGAAMTHDYAGMVVGLARDG